MIVFEGRPRKKRNLGAGTGGISGEAPQYGKTLCYDSTMSSVSSKITGG